MKMMPVRKGKALIEHEKTRAESPELIIDGTERRRQRPKDKETQKEHYSGKKKTHTDKNLIVAHAKSRRVVYLSQTYAGRVHDKSMADREGIRYAKETHLHQDTGFQGYAPKVAQISQPKKSLVKRS